uniref:Uncharacterized protein n=1 Tax=Strigamia maritima TaxID=126957 RepID=T1IHE4_STRMM
MATPTTTTELSSLALSWSDGRSGGCRRGRCHNQHHNIDHDDTTQSRT